jgi:hypothetical protein
VWACTSRLRYLVGSCSSRITRGGTKLPRTILIDPGVNTDVVAALTTILKKRSNMRSITFPGQSEFVSDSSFEGAYADAHRTDVIWAAALGIVDTMRVLRSVW